MKTLVKSAIWFAPALTRDITLLTNSQSQPQARVFAQAHGRNTACRDQRGFRWLPFSQGNIDGQRMEVRTNAWISGRLHLCIVFDRGLGQTWTSVL